MLSRIERRKRGGQGRKDWSKERHNNASHWKRNMTRERRNRNDVVSHICRECRAFINARLAARSPTHRDLHVSAIVIVCVHCVNDFVYSVCSGVRMLDGYLAI